MLLDLTDEEAEALATFLRTKLGEERFPMAPRLAPIRAVLDKLAPSPPKPEPKPPLPDGSRITGRGRRR